MDYTRYLGWDVHGETIVIAEALPGRDPARDVGTIPNTSEAVLRWIRKQSDAPTILIAYEAGPTGFGLARLCQREGIAPGRIPFRSDLPIGLKPIAETLGSWPSICGRVN